MRWSALLYRSGDEAEITNLEVLGPWFSTRAEAVKACRRALELAKADGLDLEGWILEHRQDEREVERMATDTDPKLIRWYNNRLSKLLKIANCRGHDQDNRIADEIVATYAALERIGREGGEYDRPGAVALAERVRKLIEAPNKAKILKAFDETYTLIRRYLQSFDTAGRVPNDPDLAKAFTLAQKVVKDLPDDVTRPELIAATIAASETDGDTVKAIVRKLFPPKPKEPATEEEKEEKEGRKRSRVFKGLNPIWDDLSSASRATIEVWVDSGSAPARADTSSPALEVAMKTKEPSPPPAAKADDQEQEQINAWLADTITRLYKGANDNKTANALKDIVVDWSGRDGTDPVVLVVFYPEADYPKEGFTPQFQAHLAFVAPFATVKNGGGKNDRLITFPRAAILNEIRTTKHHPATVEPEPAKKPRKRTPKPKAPPAAVVETATTAPTPPAAVEHPATGTPAPASDPELAQILAAINAKLTPELIAATKADLMS